jgi:hypothetical protein
MNRLKEQAERQIEVLTEEIRQLKIELEARCQPRNSFKEGGTEAQGHKQRQIQSVGCKGTHIREIEG